MKPYAYMDINGTTVRELVAFLWELGHLFLCRSLSLLPRRVTYVEDSREFIDKTEW